MKPTILFEDKHIIVCIKPHGTPTQSRQIRTPDLVSILKNHIKQTQQTKGEPYLAVIHRLDQPVEGLLVFGKTHVAAKELTRQLTKHSFSKHYQALLLACPDEQSATLENYLIKDGSNNISRVCDPSETGAKKATLHYEVVHLPADNKPILVNILLNTGRHHQIRVQMSHIGCPIIGDRKYSPKGLDFPSDRIALCANRLTFAHPIIHKEMSFQITPAFLEQG